VSRLVTTLAGDVDAALDAIAEARAAARARVWDRAWTPVQDGKVVIDLNATLVTAYSDKESATRTWKKTFGFHPLLSYADHGAGGPRGATGRAAAPGQRRQQHRQRPHRGVRRCASATAHTPARTRRARASCGAGAHRRRRCHPHLHPSPGRDGRRVLGGAYLHHFDIHRVLAQLPEQAWTPAYQVRAPRAGEHDPVIEPRDGAWVAEATGLVDLSAWPAGTRLILRRERPHPGAQLRITDVEGHRILGMLTNTPGGQLPDLELRHRLHARVEDRIRNAKDTGMRNLPFHDLAQNRIWLEITALATDLLAFTQRLALPAPPPARTQTPPAAHPRRRRTSRAHRTTPTPPHRPGLSLGPPDHHRPRPPGRPRRALTPTT
jgi:hypothetical protein